MQREKMKQLKQHLNQVKFSQRTPDVPENENKTPKTKTLDFIPGVIVKLKLEEPCSELKKTKVRFF